MKRFIYSVFHYFKRLHERALLLGSENPYLVGLYWLIDVVQYGTVIALVISILEGFPGFGRFLLLVLACGMLKWLWTEFIRLTKESMMKDKE